MGGTFLLVCWGFFIHSCFQTPKSWRKWKSRALIAPPKLCTAVTLSTIARFRLPSRVFVLSTCWTAVHWSACGLHLMRAPSLSLHQITASSCLLPVVAALCTISALIRARVNSLKSGFVIHVEHTLLSLSRTVVESWSMKFPVWI